MKPDIVANKGKWLTNGETYSKEVYLGKHDSDANWREITEEEYEKILNMEEKSI